MPTTAPIKKIDRIYLRKQISKPFVLAAIKKYSIETNNPCLCDAAYKFIEFAAKNYKK